MDKCQSEQRWASAGVLAIHALIISQKDYFTCCISKDAIILGLVVLSLAAYGFILERKHTYYLYRKDIAKLLDNDTNAPDFMKDQTKTMVSGNGMIWLLIYFFILFAPILIQVICL